MTRKDLEQVRYIKIEIEELKEEIERARARAYPRTVLEGVRSTGKHSKGSVVEVAAIKAATIAKILQSKVIQLEVVYERAMTFIMGIDDCQTRLIFKLRCINGMTWNQVADKVGGGNTEYSVKKRYYRYLDKMGI